MSNTHEFTAQELKYLDLLGERYPTIQDVCTEIINLQAILNLPKGTEHFMSDLHGEYEAFLHILNNCSGVIREKVDLVYGDKLSEKERSEICTLIYYPEEKLRMLKQEGVVCDEWYKETLYQLIEVCKITASKYTRSKVRKALPKEFSYIIDELLHAQPDEDNNQLIYHSKIIDTIINIDNGGAFIEALATLIKRLAVDHLHIVGDISTAAPTLTPSWICLSTTTPWTWNGATTIFYGWARPPGARRASRRWCATASRPGTWPRSRAATASACALWRCSRTRRTAAAPKRRSPWRLP